jgi:DNA primase
MTIEQAKQLDMVEYLSQLGYQPARISGNNYWYISPLRDEKTPSFKVNSHLNRWYDFAEGKGGNLVDFGTLYYRCSVSDFLQKLDGMGLDIQQDQQVNLCPSVKESDNHQIKILSEHLISSYPLISYYRSRRIADEIADKYLREVRYQNGEKIYYALGFKNDSGGYELRSEHFKGSSSPKDTTFLDKGAKDLAVFEGFFNFLSYKTIHLHQEEPLRNFLILNSASFFEKSLAKMRTHDQVYLYLDNDKTGQKYMQQALVLGREKFTDERRLYQGYKDLNEWIIHIGQSQKQQLR